jgi:ATP adenylyltransferase
MGEVVWAPWRMDYIMREKETGCIFCDKPRQQRDAENYILWRGDTAFVMLNLYPYNNGHLMIVPHAHVASLTQLTPPQAAEIMALTAISEGVLRRAMQPSGFNIGLNLGTAAGAGIADHLHMHVVPRWAGDTNYMTVVSNVRVIPQLLDDTYQILAAHFQALPHNSPRP